MDNPIEIFKQNWQLAKSQEDANAPYCTLATVSATGQASVRTLVLRGVTEDSFNIFINNTSVKWQELLQSQQFELLVFWPSLMQQYRIRGEYTELPVDAMTAHWSKKPYEAKILDHFYADYQRQSSVIESREVMHEGISRLKKKYPTDKEVPFPGNAIGISIKACYVEIWHGSDADRLHHRNLYSLSGDVWERKTLVA